MSADVSVTPTLRRLHHLGYIVQDLEQAAEQFALRFGAGPFLHVGHVALDPATYRGAVAHYDHSTAFGQWGRVIVEISQIHDVEPAGLREFLAARTSPAIGHVAWLVDDLPAESERLEGLGLGLVHTGRSGPVQAHWHDGASVLGHPIEVLRRCPEILGFYDAIRVAAVGWDGSRPLRPAPGPPSS
jgi:catechol 2,3-dioxygenase-like lactoylglutathione lyase family enzyme